MAREDYLADLLQSLSGMQKGAGAGMLARLEAERGREKLMTEAEFKEEEERRKFTDKVILGSTAPGGEPATAEQIISAREGGDLSGLEYGAKTKDEYVIDPDTGKLTRVPGRVKIARKTKPSSRYKPKYLTEREDSIKSANIFLSGIEQAAKENPYEAIPMREEIAEEMLLRGIDMNIPQVNRMINSIRVTQPTKAGTKWGFFYRKPYSAKKGSVVRDKSTKKTPEGNQALKTKARQWLKSNGAPVTMANIDAVIKQGKVK